jgi:NADH dehydrogenase [ubiquinone] 1 alpha subcomplex assembly factor 5
MTCARLTRTRMNWKTAAVPLFDHNARQHRAPRINKTLTEADFLIARVAEGIADRLEDVKRAFPRMCVIADDQGRVADAIPRAKAGADALVQVVSAGLLGGAGARVSELDTPDLSPGDHDLIINALTMHRVNDPVGVLTQMRLALKPDGLALAAMFGGRTLHELRTSFAEAEAEVEGGMSPRVVPMGEIRDLGALLQRAGLALPVADVDRIPVEYESAFHLMRDLRAMGEGNPMEARRKNFTRRATMVRMAEVYAHHFASDSGRVMATFEIVFLTGWSPAANQQQPLRPGAARTKLADVLGVPEVSAGEKPEV